MLHRSTDQLDYTGRTVEGVAYRYEYPSRVTDDGWATSYYEEILRGADSRTLRHHPEFPLNRGHSQSGGHQVGVVTFHRSDDERALMFRGLVDHGRAGDQLLEEIDEWGDASVTFDPIANRQRRTPYHGVILQRAQIRIAELALMPLGTALSSGSGVLAVRGSIAEPAGTPVLDRLRRRRSALL
jgi:hypothetical protein